MSARACEWELKKRLREVEQEIRKSWENYKSFHETMTDVRVKDNAIRMVLLWMLRNDLIPRDEEIARKSGEEK